MPAPSVKPPCCTAACEIREFGGTLCVSQFVPTIYFGVLVSLSMIGGLIGNLLVLPVLIRLVDR